MKGKTKKNYKNEKTALNMFLFLCKILSIDYSVGYYVITKPGSTEYLMTYPDGTLRSLEMPYPKSINDRNVVKLDVKSDGYSIKFMATGKYLCVKGIKPGAYSCDNRDAKQTKFKIIDKNGNKIIKSSKKCLYRAGISSDKGQYLALVKCGLFKNKQAWEVNELKLGEDIVSSTSRNKNSSEMMGYLGSLERNISLSRSSRSLNRNIALSRSSEASLSASDQKDMERDSSVSGISNFSKSGSVESKILNSDGNSSFEIKPNNKGFASNESTTLITESTPINVITGSQYQAQQCQPVCCTGASVNQQNNLNENDAEKDEKDEKDEKNEKNEKKEKDEKIEKKEKDEKVEKKEKVGKKEKSGKK
ncbi:hypothetical protein DMUE_4044 [Dictyocoela muelleri]|nr:hypothetical protein DMUE_4044 [Dictyocoela muelleri]